MRRNLVPSTSLLMPNDRTEMAQLAHRLDDDRETIPLVEERAVVRKRKRLTGGVRVRTVVVVIVSLLPLASCCTGSGPRCWAQAAGPGSSRRRWSLPSSTRT